MIVETSGSLTQLSAVFDIKPGSPPIALFGPALAPFADLEEKDPDLDDSPVAEFPLDIAIGADCFAENLAFNTDFLLASRAAALQSLRRLTSSLLG